MWKMNQFFAWEENTVFHILRGEAVSGKIMSILSSLSTSMWLHRTFLFQVFT